MTKRLEEALSKVRKLSPDRQEDAANLLFTLLEQDETPSPQLSAQQAKEVREAVERADAGEFASDEQVEAVYRKHGA